MTPLEDDDPWLMTAHFDATQPKAPRRIRAGSPQPIDLATCCVFDLETYPGRWLVGFSWTGAGGEPLSLVVQDQAALEQALAQFAAQKFTLVGYNSAAFDIPLVRAILGGHDPYEPAQAIIAERAFPIPLAKLPEFPCDHVDLSARVKRGLAFPSLKLLAANLGRPVLRELPFEPGSILTDDQWSEVIAYNAIDLGHTQAVLEYFEPDLQALAALSKEMGQDLRSTATPKVVEIVFLDAYEKQHGRKPTRPGVPAAAFYRGVPGVTRPRTEAAAAWYDMVFNRAIPVVMKEGRPTIKVPSATFLVGGIEVTVGAGGLHSADARHVHYSTAEHQLLLVDAASFYPSLIATKGISPRAYGDTGAAAYRSIRERRLEIKNKAKKTTDPTARARLGAQADGLKLVLNSFFGKLGSQFSTLFDFEAFLKVTLSGQLMLIDLIERLAVVDVRILSANTDGLYLQVSRMDERWREVLVGWERDGEMTLEIEPIRRLVIFAANTYATIDDEGHVKRRGAKLKGDFEALATPKNLVVNDAVARALLEDVPPELTVLACKEPARFCSTSQISNKVGSAVIIAGDGTETALGKISRWYHARECPCRIEHRLKSGKHTTPAGAEDIALLMNLPGTAHPPDLDLGWYFKEARDEIQKTPGYRHRAPELLLGHAPALAVLGHGLVPAPKRRKALAIGSKADAPTFLWSWGWSGYSSVGTYTGPGTGILVVDIDQFETFRARLDRSNTPLEHDRWHDLDGCLVSFHGEATADQVRAGRARGKLVFRFEADADHALARVKVDRWRDEWGIDLFYGRDIPTVYGLHPDGSQYRIEGTLGAAPGWMVEAFTSKFRPKTAPKTGRKAGGKTGTKSTKSTATNPEEFAGLIGELAALSPMLGGSFKWRRKKLEEGRVILVARCPWHKKGSPDDLWAGWNDKGEPYLMCKHATCDAVPGINAVLKDRHKAAKAPESDPEASKGPEPDPKPDAGAAPGASGRVNDYYNATAEELGIVDASTIEEENPVWLWEGRFLRGKLNLIAGAGGDGKTTIAVMVGATVTVGGMFPDGSPAGPPGVVMMIAAEDGAADTLKPRFVAAGGDVSLGKLLFLKAEVVIPKKGDRPALVHPITLQDHEYWEPVFIQYRPSVLIVDPLPPYLGRNINDHKNSDVQTVLNAFARLAARFNVCFIGVTHTGKSRDLKLTHRVLSSIAYTNCARVVHVTVRDPDDEERRYFARTKCNLDAPRNPLAYRIVGVEYHRADRTFKTSRVEFEPEPVDVDVEAMASGSEKPRRATDPAKTMACAEWLFDFLAERTDPIPLAALIEAAGKAGFGGNRNKDGRWCSSTLYRAQDLIPKLEPPRGGREIEETQRALKDGGRMIKHWALKVHG